MDTNVDKMLQYCSSIASEFSARLNRIRAYVPNHKPSAGVANEAILRNFLAQLSAARYAVGQGFICDPVMPELVSRQCDILVYDQHSYPLVYSEGDINVVFPHAVEMLIEVKTGLSKQALRDALDNIGTAKQMKPSINGVIFAFESPKTSTIIKNLQECSAGVTLQHLPIAILLLDKGTIIHRWPGTGDGGKDNPYQVCVSSQNMPGTVIAFLLLLFFDVLMQGVWGGASVVNMLQKLLADDTAVLLDELIP
ncbi:MAG: hypothetical protein H6667_07345 [Ardenticatenaceae bacterium]|nr:hypothetical protein [Ardenticatenaceae bacterium]MCB9444106.1 hypothetical protein [Ardenticatenaceae bacterium]